MVRASATGAARFHIAERRKMSNTIYEEAKRVYERILREKAGKDYQIAQATATATRRFPIS